MNNVRRNIFIPVSLYLLYKKYQICQIMSHSALAIRKEKHDSIALLLFDINSINMFLPGVDILLVSRFESFGYPRLIYTKLAMWRHTFGKIRPDRARILTLALVDSHDKCHSNRKLTAARFIGQRDRELLEINLWV
jgi:hypothetical protein